MVTPGIEHVDLAVAEIAGVRCTVNVGLLEEPVAPGDGVLVHMGLALSTVPDDEMEDTLASLGLTAEERESACPPPRNERELPAWTR